MSQNLEFLAARLRAELAEVEHTLVRATEGMQRARQTGDDHYLDGVALNLHGFYSGLERIFELIAVHVDGVLPKGENWHQELLNQMAEEKSGFRPSVISEDLKKDLDVYRGFRHVVRNVYTYKFDPTRIEHLMDKVTPLFTRLRSELLAFADFLTASDARKI